MADFSFCYAIVILALLTLLPVAAQAHDVTIDTSSARATLAALSDQKLQKLDAEKVARMPGNVALIRKQAEFGEGGSEARFVAELMAQARGQKPDGEAFYHFAAIAAVIPAITRTLSAIELDNLDFSRSINDRVKSFSPKGADFDLHGYFILGGGSSGFTLGGRNFYLNIGHYGDDLETARLTTAHELYHAIQDATLARADKTDYRNYDPAIYASLPAGRDKKAYIIERFLSNLFNEGTATYVGDPALMTGDARMARMERARLKTQLDRTDRLATQLDMSLLALTADKPIEYERAYAFGFYGPDQPLYYLGYVMAKAITARHGPGRLGEIISGTGCNFVQEYMSVAGDDATLPELGPDTRRLVSEYCRKGS